MKGASYAALIAGVLAVLGGSALVSATSTPSRARQEPDDVDSGTLVTQIRYRIVTKAPPRTFVNDRGYTISLERAFLTNSSMGLTRCVAKPPGAKAARVWLRELVGVPLAHAGHDVVLDLSFSDQGLVEDLIRPSDQVFAESYFPATRYCRFHYTAGRGESSYRGYPASVPFEGFSFHVKGTYARGDVSRVFVLETDLPYGSLLELPELNGRRNAGGTRGQVTIEHSLERALRDVDFANEDHGAASKRVLQHLIDDAKITFDVERT